MAAAPGVAGSKSNTVSDEERRWVVLGICLHKVLTPALRDVLDDEIQKWYQLLLQPPHEIDKQTFAKHDKKLAPSILKLNYGSINNNTVHKSPLTYDYTVKDPLSLAKLFMKPHMANFTGFDQTMDTSAVLSVMCEAQPFFTSGAAGIAKKVRSDIRNEWAHCNFSHWTDPNFQAALQSMKSLIKKVNLIPVEEKRLLDELDDWKIKGFQLCFGQPVDPALLKLIKTEVDGLNESIKLRKEDNEREQKLILNSLASIIIGLKQEIEILKEKQALTESKLDNYVSSSSREIEILQNKLSKVVLQSDEDIAYVFRAPQPNPWFSGRKCQIQELKNLLLGKEERVNTQKKVSLAAICGLGGSGKTSLVAEYAQRMKDHYQGGVFWFSGEDDIQLESSVNAVAMDMATFQDNSFDATLSKTLARISRIRKPWLIVIDDMDELHLSQNVTKIISGSWQQGVTGHVVMTTRRKPGAVANDIRGFQESCCIQIECFDPKQAKIFLFKRTGIQCDKETDPVADSLVAELGGLPLALEQAGAYIKSLDCSLSSYLKSYKAETLRLLHLQSVTRVSEYESPERLAVKTTWCLNFGHIKQSVGGENVIRFLNACSFFNPNEIQQELINIGEPFVEDEQFRKFVSAPLGCKQVLKMLTDFSLFKKSEEGGLCVHRLVQEVVQENLSLDEKARSFVDAVRLIRCAFSTCPSPDELLSSVSNEQQHRVSVDSVDPSRFHQWSRLCLHSHEIRKHVEKFLKQSENSTKKTVWFLETARIVYECALHLSVNCRHEEAKQTVKFAYRIHDWAHDVSVEKIHALFPHILPLPGLVRRHIQYSCKDPDVLPSTGGILISGKIPSDSDESVDLKKMRSEGNRLFKEGRFKESLELYSSVIKMSEGTNLFDPTLLSNRASAYLKLGQCESALKDAEHYMRLCPKCWKGYARKALSLHGLGDVESANMAAALAFYQNRCLFREFGPFKRVFPSLEKYISVCGNPSEFTASLPPFNVDGCNSNQSKILVLEPGNYNMAVDCIDRSKCDRLVICNSILLGVEDKVMDSGVTFNFLDSVGVLFHACTAANITFRFDQGNCHSDIHPIVTVDQSTGNRSTEFLGSIVKLSNCTVTCKNEQFPSFSSKASLNVANCNFKNCKAGGLLVGGVAEIQDSIFAGNGSAGLEVREGGYVEAKNCDMYGNKQGVLIGPKAEKCTMLDCRVYDNVCEGIVLTDSEHVTLKNNHIFHNDHYGISLSDGSFAIIDGNEIFENCWWGIIAVSDSRCHVSRNNIYRNKCGGIHVVPLTDGGPEVQGSVVEFNKISENGGPGIDETVTYSETSDLNDLLKSARSNYLKKSKCTGNELVDNIEQKSPPKSERDKEGFCSLCRKKDSLKKCCNCFTAEYCQKKCQKLHWKRHKIYCDSLLKKSSVVVEIVQVAFGIARNIHIGNLQPVGPEYAESPSCGTRFIVKIQADGMPWKPDIAKDPALLHVYDRSTTVSGNLEHPHIYDLVRQHGFNCETFIWKKMFFWALLLENGMLRLFINEFPPYQPW